MHRRERAFVLERRREQREGDLIAYASPGCV
jgi:hypothetical protein